MNLGSQRRSGVAGRGFVEPMMATLVDKPPEGPEWLHEIKYDGYRTQIVIAGNKARAYTRRGLDWTKKYSRIIDAARELGRDCHLEGEMIVQDANGRPDFNALRMDIESGAGGRLILYTFDLLSLDGQDLRAKPCEERRALLSDLLGSPLPSYPIHFSEAHGGPGKEFFAAVERMDLEGMVSKKRTSPYRSGYTNAWLKVKTFLESEFVVVGYDTTPGGVRSLLVAREQDGQLMYAGRVMVTLRGRKREAIWTQLEEHRTDKPAIPELQHGGEVEWFTPGVSVRVRHLRGEETLRHATLLGRGD
jgi:bifunctional non-homologous end joining protein LigD